MSRLKGWFPHVGLKNIFVIVFCTLLISGCVAYADEKAGHAGSDTMRQKAVVARENNFSRAEVMWPAPTDLSNFPMRQALVDFTERQDLINHPWYIYLLGQNGDYIGYYVGKTYPQSVCNFLSSTERFVDLPDAQWGTATSPSYDGVFYGNCNPNEMFFFDATTNAMITFVSNMWFAADAPFDITVKPLNVNQTVAEQNVPQPSTASTEPTPTAIPSE